MFSNTQNLFTEIRSPLDQFEVRDILNLEVLGGNLHLSITNIGFYLTLGAIITIVLSLVATNNNKLVSNN
jgi:F-type H+-transporting ATPase subunit a